MLVLQEYQIILFKNNILFNFYPSIDSVITFIKSWKLNIKKN